MGVRLATAVLAGKVAGVASRRFGRGGGTALPGLVATRLDPGIVTALSSRIPVRVAVTGTNGKTTTCHMLASSFAAAGLRCLHNREGSNMVRGFASTLLARADLRGRTPPFDVALFETDEASMPAGVAAIQPSVIAFTNLFRDQLDRYGEVDTVAALWRESLAVAPPGSTLVLAADDPLVAGLADGWSGPVHFFGMDVPALVSATPGASDARWCAGCGAGLAYDARYYAHVGHWRCDGCGRHRPVPETRGTAFQPGLDGSVLAVDGFDAPLQVPIAGLYNAYNALAAIAVARVVGLAPETIRSGLASTHAAFGRQETVVYRGRRLRLLLCKNPAGANQVLFFLRSIATGTEPLKVAVALNDRFADGRDVSWTWDVDYEALASEVGVCWAAGERAEDMALRLKYAGWPPVAGLARSPGALLDLLLAEAAEGEDIFVLPTYTAMLDLRGELVARGAAEPYWER